MGELESIRTFLTVADQRSFAGAARLTGTTPASVTRTVAALEERLGVQLLLRTTRQVSLTGAGAGYAARVRPLAEGIAAAAEETRELQGLASGLLRISAPTSLGLRILPDVLSRFAILHPGTRVALNLWDGMVDIIEADYDLAVRVSGPPDGKSTIWRKICPVPRAIVASPGYVALHGMPRTPADLSALACLSYSETAQDEVWHLSRGTSRHAHIFRGNVVANNGDLLARLAATRKWVQATMAFIKQEMKEGDILRCTYHGDEKTSHIHVENMPTYLKKSKRGSAVWGSHQKASWGGTLGYVKFLDRYAEAVKHLGIERGEAPKNEEMKELMTPTSKTEHARRTLLKAEKTMQTAEEKLQEAEKKLKEANLYQAAVKASAEAIIDEQIAYRPANKERPEGLKFGPNQPEEQAERQMLVDLITPALSWAIRFAKKIYSLTGSSGGVQNAKSTPEKLPAEKAQKDKLTQTLEAARQKARDRAQAQSLPTETPRVRKKQVEL